MTLKIVIAGCALSRASYVGDFTLDWPFLSPLDKNLCARNLPAETDLRTSAAIIKARCICEQAHQQLKKNLGSITSRAGPGRACIGMRS